MSEDFSFEIEFYEALDRRISSDARVLELLAQLYTREGRNAEGLSMDLRLSNLRPKDPMVHYNLACSLALVGQENQAIETLRAAIQMGYSDFDWMMRDSDLDSIRECAGYQELLKEIGQTSG